MEFYVYHFTQFLLVFARIMGLMFTSTFFESSSVSNQTRMGLTFFIAIVMFPTVYQYLPNIPSNMVMYGFTAIGEALIGALIGICVAMSFSVYQLAGQYFSVQLGLGASEVFDPMSQISLPIMGQFLYYIAILVFFAVGGPMLILNELSNSYALVTFVGLVSGNVVMSSEYGMIGIFADIFLVAMRISLPIIAVLLAVTICQGLLVKAAPELNLMNIGFPISILIGFVTIVLFVPGFVDFVYNYMDAFFSNIMKLMQEIHNAS